MSDPSYQPPADPTFEAVRCYLSSIITPHLLCATTDGRERLKTQVDLDEELARQLMHEEQQQEQRRRQRSGQGQTTVPYAPRTRDSGQGQPRHTSPPLPQEGAKDTMSEVSEQFTKIAESACSGFLDLGVCGAADARC